MLRNLIGLVVLGWVLSACGFGTPIVEPSETATAVHPSRPTATAVPSSTDIAKLLASPPAIGTVVELDAYYLRRWNRGPDTHTLIKDPPELWLHCPNPFTALTDKPMYGYVQDLLGAFGNPPLKSEPYLVAVDPAFTQPQAFWISPALPYHARLRGRFGDPAFADCDEAARIFVVEQVVQVYQEDVPENAFELELPADIFAWTRYENQAQGYSIAHPSAWVVTSLTEPDTVNAVAITSPRYPDFPVTVRVFEHQNVLDEFDLSSSPLGKISEYSQLQQGDRFGSKIQTQQLTGESRAIGTKTDKTNFAVFKHRGATFVIGLKYPLGSRAPQDLITTFITMVESFRLEN